MGGEIYNLPDDQEEEEHDFKHSFFTDNGLIVDLCDDKYKNPEEKKAFDEGDFGITKSVLTYFWNSSLACFGEEHEKKKMFSGCEKGIGLEPKNHTYMQKFTVPIGSFKIDKFFSFEERSKWDPFFLDGKLVKVEGKHTAIVHEQY